MQDFATLPPGKWDFSPHPHPRSGPNSPPSKTLRKNDGGRGRVQPEPPLTSADRSAHVASVQPTDDSLQPRPLHHPPPPRSPPRRPEPAGEQAALADAHAPRATVLHEANVYLAPDPDSQKVSLVTPGHEVVITEHSGPWIKVFANTDVKDDAASDIKPEFTEEENVTPASGWIRDKAVVSRDTPSGDVILFGAAATEEDAAAQPHAPVAAAAAAHLLYRRIGEYFPQSPLAPEAAWRAADVRWQIDQHDIRSLPSAKEQDAYLRPQVSDAEMKRVIKTYPGTRYAALASYALLDNKLCGDWQGLPKCPEMEAGLYEKYARQFPDSPRTPEALYNAAYREGVAVTMFNVDGDQKKAAAAAARVQAIADDARTRYAASDWTARTVSLAYRVAQGVAIYGSDRD